MKLSTPAGHTSAVREGASNPLPTKKKSCSQKDHEGSAIVSSGSEPPKAESLSALTVPSWHIFNQSTIADPYHAAKPTANVQEIGGVVTASSRRSSIAPWIP